MFSADGITWGGAGPSTESADITDGTVHWKYIYQKPFSRLGDYPAAIGHFNGCMYYGGTLNDPQQALRSEPFDYGNFNYSDSVVYTTRQLKDAATWADPQVPETEDITETRIVYGDGNAFEFEIASKQNEKILWMVGADAMVIGTDASEYVVPEDISALNIMCKRRSGFGSVAIQPEMFGDSPVFIQGGEGECFMREYNYLAQSAELQSPDLTFAADHMLKDRGGADGLHPPSASGHVRSDEDGRDFRPALQQALWSDRVASIVHSWRTVHERCHGRRHLRGSGVRDREPWRRLHHRAVRCLWGTTDKCLDSWAQYTVAGATEAGLTRMASQTASIYNVTDAAWFTAAVDAGGVLTYPVSCGVGDVVIIGLPYTPHGQTMPIPTMMQTGPGIGSIKRVVSVVMRVLESFPFKVSGDGTHWDTAQRADGVAWTAAYTGDVIVPVPGTGTARVVCISSRISRNARRYWP